MNVAEGVVAKALLPYEELFTPVLPGQDHKAVVLHLFQLVILAMMNSSANVTNSKDEFDCKGAKHHCQRDEVNCKGD